MISYLLGILGALLVLGVIIQLTRTNRLRERQAVWWLVVSLLALIVSVFPSSLEFAAGALGIAVPANLAFFVAIALLVIVSLQLSADLSKLEGKTRTLAENQAILKWEIENLKSPMG